MLTKYLQLLPAPLMNSYAVAVAFATYFCMYAFRKPFAAATYEGLHLFGTEIELKTVFVISQICGYALSKLLGIKFCSETSRARRAVSLVALITAAEAALLLFAVLPDQWKVVAIFLNGLPLGMVWGLVVWYLEGRCVSEILLAGLSCSFIVSSGVVKDVGRALMAGESIPLLAISLPNFMGPISEFWMPAVTGLLFYLPFCVAVWLLDQLPEPSEADVAARTSRQPMNHRRRIEFFWQYLPGLLMLTLAYFFLTAFRDFRDNYAVEVLDQLGYPYAEYGDIISRMEFGVAFGVMLTMSLLFLIKDNRRGLIAVFAVIGAGFAMLGVATYLLQQQYISGFWWMVLIGLGSYLAYVPYNSVLFDRLMAATQFVGTAVFSIYVADTFGYSGSIIVQLFRDLVVGESSRLSFLVGFSYFMALLGGTMALGTGIYFLRKWGYLSAPGKLVVVGDR